MSIRNFDSSFGPLGKSSYKIEWLFPLPGIWGIWIALKYILQISGDKILKFIALNKRLYYI